jgi:hypothetical protein
VPSGYPAGTVGFKILIQTTQKAKGQFVQMPVSSAMLTISPTPPPVASTGPAAATAALPATQAVSIYVDSVNGTRPAGAAPRPIGCTQTNVYKRGEQFVLRSWGTDESTGAILSTDTVSEAHFSIAGQPDVKLNWGAHGTAGSQVYFWSAPWNIPADYPLGDATVKVTYTLEGGKVGTYDYPITITP